MADVLSWLRSFWPAPLMASRREQVLSWTGALLALLTTEWIGRQALGAASPWFVAPMGASAVLLFAVPSSPLAQPWPVLGGNLLAALVGVACARTIADPGMAASIAVALSIALMFPLRCLHPPGGAVAITCVFGGAQVDALGYAFALWPVGLNSLCMLLLALAFNQGARRRYPNRPAEERHPHGTADPPPSERLGITPADLDAVLQARGEVLDIGSEDLEEILLAAERRAWRRRFGDIRCADVMSRDLVTIGPDAPLHEAWGLLTRHGVRLLPVVEAGRRLVGVLSLHDFIVLRDPTFLLDGSVAGAARHRVAELMTREVVTVRPEQPVVDLVPLFSDSGRHYVPVVNAAGEVVGMLTQSDLVAALYRAGLEQVEAPARA
jgi:CBS domain-containing membrane protein